MTKNFQLGLNPDRSQGKCINLKFQTHETDLLMVYNHMGCIEQEVLLFHSELRPVWNWEIKPKMYRL